jgi:hypothetical protein
MSKAILDHKGDTLRVIQDDIVLGEIRKIKDGDFSWESRLALGPMRRGRCTSEQAALAHLGYKPVNRR